MTNPRSLELRGLRPLRSWPAELLDFELRFDLGRTGMADARARAGASFHGVLHEIEAAQMAALDAIEAGYKRVAARARRYDGAVVDAFVYSAPRDAATGAPLPWHGSSSAAASPPPAQRYIELVVAGCRHFGVAESHCAALLALEQTPRTRPGDFRAFPVPPGLPLWDEARLIAEPEPADASVLISMNGKVLKVGGALGAYLKKNKAHGARYELTLSRLVYDPQYGTPERLEDFSREHAAYIEDFYLRGFCSEPGTTIEVVALLPQRYRDDFASGGGGGGGGGAGAAAS